MSWEPQGLISYYCCICERNFIVGLVDDRKQKPSFCPYCGPDGAIDDTSDDWGYTMRWNLVRMTGEGER